MNSKLPRLVLVGVGTVAVAVLSAFSARNPGASSSGAALGTLSRDAGALIVQHGPPASAVRG